MVRGRAVNRISGFNDTIINKLKMIGISDVVVSLIRSLWFEVFDSEYSMITNDTNSSLNLGSNDGKYIDIKWYADQLRQYYKSVGVTGIKTNFLKITEFNGIPCIDILESRLWSKVVEERIWINAIQTHYSLLNILAIRSDEKSIIKQEYDVVYSAYEQSLWYMILLLVSIESEICSISSSSINNQSIKCVEKGYIKRSKEEIIVWMDRYDLSNYLSVGIGIRKIVTAQTYEMVIINDKDNTVISIKNTGSVDGDGSLYYIHSIIIDDKINKIKREIGGKWRIVTIVYGDINSMEARVCDDRKGIRNSLNKDNDKLSILFLDDKGTDYTVSINL